MRPISGSARPAKTAIRQGVSPTPSLRDESDGPTEVPWNEGWSTDEPRKWEREARGRLGLGEAPTREPAEATSASDVLVEAKQRSDAIMAEAERLTAERRALAEACLASSRRDCQALIDDVRALVQPDAGSPPSSVRAHANLLARLKRVESLLESNGSGWPSAADHEVAAEWDPPQRPASPVDDRPLNSADQGFGDRIPRPPWERDLPRPANSWPTAGPTLGEHRDTDTPPQPSDEVEAGPSGASSDDETAPFAAAAPPGPSATALLEDAPTTVISHERSPDAPLAPPAAESRPSRTELLAYAGLWLRRVGIVILLFCAYQLWGTSLWSTRIQTALRSDFQAQSAVTRQLPPDVAQPPPVSSLPAARPGDPVAVIDIPRLGVERIVVEGSGVDQLRAGPGHQTGSAAPGAAGNVVVAGHRVTYGDPFRDVDVLRIGDTITITTAAGPVEYYVSEQGRRTSADDAEPFGDFGDDRLTLVTSDPLYQASDHLIVVAQPVDPLPPMGVVERKEQKPIGTPGGSLLPVLFWAGALGGIAVAFRRLRRSRPRPVSIAAVVLALIALVALFESVGALLPATL